MLTVRGFVHCVPEFEASGMFVPQLLQLRPQQDVFLGLQETDRQSGKVTDTSTGTDPEVGRQAPVDHTQLLGQVGLGLVSPETSQEFIFSHKTKDLRRLLQESPA